jgi:hypothetical protein
MNYLVQIYEIKLNYLKQVLSLILENKSYIKNIYFIFIGNLYFVSKINDYVIRLDFLLFEIFIHFIKILIINYEGCCSNQHKLIIF